MGVVTLSRFRQQHQQLSMHRVTQGSRQLKRKRSSKTRVLGPYLEVLETRTLLTVSTSGFPVGDPGGAVALQSESPSAAPNMRDDVINMAGPFNANLSVSNASVYIGALHATFSQWILFTHATVHVDANNQTANLTMTPENLSLPASGTSDLSFISDSPPQFQGMNNLHMDLNGAGGSNVSIPFTINASPISVNVSGLNLTVIFTVNGHVSDLRFDSTDVAIAAGDLFAIPGNFSATIDAAVSAKLVLPLGLGTLNLGTLSSIGPMTETFAAGDLGNIALTDNGGIQFPHDMHVNMVLDFGDISAALPLTQTFDTSSNYPSPGNGSSGLTHFDLQNTVLNATLNLSNIGYNFDGTDPHVVLPDPNFPPLVDLNGAAGGADSTSTWHGTDPVAIADQATVSDPQVGNLTSMTVTLTNPQAGDVLTVTTTMGTNIARTYSGGTLRLTGSDTPAAYQAVLSSITYNNTAGGPGVASETATVVASNDFLTSVVATATINTNARPTVDLNGTAPGTGYGASWNGGTSIGIADPLNARVTDDGGTLASIKVVLNSPHAGDVLAAITVGSISQNFANNTLTLSGTDSVANYQAVLRSVTYNNTAPGGPGVSSETVNVVANDGLLDSTPAVVATININNPPVVDLNGAGGGTGTTATWVGTGPVPISDPTATVTDADGGTLTSIKISLNTPHAGDVLAATTTAGITQSFVNNTLTLSGSDSLANYQTVLRSVTYDNTSLAGPTVNVETANVVANDGTLNGNTAVATINMPPTIILTVGAGSGTPNFTTSWYNNGATGNNGAVPIENMAQATVNSPSGFATISSMTVKLATFHTGDVLAVPILTGVSGSLTTTYSNGTLVLSGTDTVANYQKELRFVNYNNTAGGPDTSPVLITFTANDGMLNSTPVMATVNIKVASGQVFGNRLFYNNSKYDNNNTAISASDDLAIASDKIGYTPGSGLSTFAAVSGFNKGITGVMVDLASSIGTHTNINLTSGDITFKISPITFVTTTFNQLSTWSVAPTPANISVRMGAGASASDRLEITWANLKVTNTWLGVTVHANANTGLTADDVFYFASVIGNSGAGDTTALSRDDASDLTATGNNVVGMTTPVWNALDYTKDFKVDANDATTNTNNIFTLRYISNPVGTFAPDAGPSASPAASPAASSAAVASGVSLSSSSLSSTLPSWLSGRLHSILDSQGVAKTLKNLKPPDSAQIHQAIDQVTEKFHLNDDLLDGLLADLDLAQPGA